MAAASCQLMQEGAWLHSRTNSPCSAQFFFLFVIQPDIAGAAKLTKQWNGLKVHNMEQSFFLRLTPTHLWLIAPRFLKMTSVLEAKGTNRIVYQAKPQLRRQDCTMHIAWFNLEHEVPYSHYVAKNTQKTKSHPKSIFDVSWLCVSLNQHLWLKQKSFLVHNVLHC